MLLLDGGTDWKSEIFKRLDAIGEKLGVAASHLWSVLVRQGIATGFADAGAATILIALAVVASQLARKWFKAGNVEDEDKFYLVGCSIGAWCVTGVLCLGAFFYAYDATLELINPEYFALHKIIEQLR